MELGTLLTNEPCARKRKYTHVFCDHRPLHDAAESNDVAAVQLLLEHGAVATAENYSGETPYTLTSSSQVRRLLQGNVVVTLKLHFLLCSRGHISVPHRVFLFSHWQSRYRTG